MFSHHQTAQEPSLFVSFASDKMHYMASDSTYTSSNVHCQLPSTAFSETLFQIDFISFRAVSACDGCVCVCSDTICNALALASLHLPHFASIFRVFWIVTCVNAIWVVSQNTQPKCKHSHSHTHTRSNCLPLLICRIIYFSIFIYLFVVCAFHIMRARKETQ